ncbi:Molybdopterin-guanine dinucleotide biosynthesis protein MobB [hydrothermal vent metagenome]|uniref:Molybdopterin-guanine dinucleotide biosynthesis protein MobB n=1 Tax=hydrothermal vent metagenome TaxID=652676 RepID=A0A3B1B123_9ZZZZ
MLHNQNCPLLGVVAFSGTGKTTLLKQLIPLLKSQNLKLGLIKHAHHHFDIDIPGKDSYELRKAGADQVLVASQQRWAMILETPEQDGDPELSEMLAHLDQASLDLILVEGFKHVTFPKLELHRPSLGHPLLFPDDADILAVATDAPLNQECTLPVLDLNQPDAITYFIKQHFLAS